MTIYQKYADRIPRKMLEDIQAQAEGLSEARVKKILDDVAIHVSQSKAEAGEAVGILAAQSIGEPGTQMTLKMFHMPGIAELAVPQGLPRFTEIIDVRRSPSLPITNIYLKKCENREQAVAFAKSIEELTAQDVGEVLEDFEAKKVILRLNPRRLQEENIDIEKAGQTIEKAIRRKATKIEGNDIIFELKHQSLKLLRRLSARLRETHIKGIKDIKKAAVVYKNEEFIIQTEGTNLREILALEEVDHTRTSSNNIREVELVLGIEAARGLILREAKNVLDTQGLPVNVRHLMLVADLMCVDGNVRAVGRTGISGSKTSVFARAAFEETVRHLLDAALKGTKDELKGVAENIIVGQPIPVGTGRIKLVMK